MIRVSSILSQLLSLVDRVDFPGLVNVHQAEKHSQGRLSEWTKIKAPKKGDHNGMHKISVIVPAHNEERYITRCLASIRQAAEQVSMPVEIVVVLNRCTDRTAEIAREYGALTVSEDAKNLARIRNAGCRAATGDVIVTLDADSWMSAGMLSEVMAHIQSGMYIGGGVKTRPERLSLGIMASLMMLLPFILKGLLTGLSAGMFWLAKEDFDALGGFNEQYVSAEDYCFAHKLKAYGQEKGLRYGTIRRARITTSCRKFDQFGDWYLFLHPRLVRDIFSGRSQEAANDFYYDLKR